MKLERLAGSVNEFHNVASNAANWQIICGLFLFRFYIVILLYLKFIYEGRVPGNNEIRVPFFDKP
jgi:hypothetical protein